MTPDWERLATNMVLPTDVFTYRYRNNDPINGWRSQAHDQQSIGFMSSIDDWLKLLGYDINKMQGSKYVNQMVYKPRTKVESTRLPPQFEVVSGLKCIVDKVRTESG
jgi:teneurin